MSLSRKVISVLFFFCILAATAAADTVVLKTGQTVEGTIVETTDKAVVIEFSGVKLTYAQDEIASVLRTDQAAKNLSEETTVAVSDSKEEAIRQLLEVSGFKVQLTDAIISLDVPQDTAERLKNRPELNEKLNDLLASAKQPGRAYAMALQIFREHYDASGVKEALQWLESPLGKRVTEMEKKAEGDKKTGAIAAYAQQLSKDSIPASRRELLMRVNAATGCEDLTVTALTDMMRVFAEEMNAVLPENQKVGPEKLAQLEAGMAQQMKERMRNALFISSAYTYRELPDQELTQYLAFLESPAGQWMYVTGDGAILNVLHTLSKELARGLADIMKTEMATRRANAKQSSLQGGN